MRLIGTIVITGAALLPQAGYAQSSADAAATLGRDIIAPKVPVSRDSVANPRTETNSAIPASSISGLGNIYINAVNIDGGQRLAGTDFQSATGQFVGKAVSVDDLQKLARSVADEARARGYIFASAMIPEQEIRLGIIRVHLDEGHVDEVRVTGSNSQRLRRILNEMIGPVATKAVIERQLLLAEDLPGISIADTRFVREGARGVLIIDVKDDRSSGSATLDNFGSKGTGPIRLRLDLNLSSLIADGDELSVSTVATPISPRELAYVSASYTMPVGDSGARLGIAAGAGRTQPSDIPGHVLIGRSRTVSANASYPLLRSNNASVWVNAEIAYLNVDSKVVGLLLQRDDLVTMSLSVNGSMRVASGRLSGGLGYVRGLSLLGANTAGDPFSSRPDASGQFNKFTGWLNWSGPIGGDFSLRLAANGQIATAPLLSSQEMGVGGPGFGRAYDFSERFGDGGLLGLAELRRDFSNPVRHIDWAQVYGFADGGYVYNLQGGLGGGTLMSAGGGVRAGAGPVEFGLEAAVPIKTLRAEGGDSPRFNLSLGYNF